MIDSGFEPKLFGTKAFPLLLYKGTFFFFQFVQTWAGGEGVYIQNCPYEIFFIIAICGQYSNCESYD